MATLPFTTAVVQMLNNPPWTGLAPTYLAHSGIVIHVQRVNLDAPENRDMVQNTLNSIKTGILGEVHAISLEAKNLSAAGGKNRVKKDTIFGTVGAVRTCIAVLTEKIFTAGQKAGWKFPQIRDDQTHRKAITALCLEVLADLGNTGGYFGHQLKSKRKAPIPQTQREESPLFIAQDEDALDGAAVHRREGSSPQGYSVSEEEMRTVGVKVLEANEGAGTGDRRELRVCQGDCFKDLEEANHRNWEKQQEINSFKASVAELQSEVKEADHRNWKKEQEINSLKASVAALQSEVEVLKEEEETNSLKASVAELQSEVKEADHRNWEKEQEINSLKAELQSEVEVLSAVVEETCEENHQLRARIRKLE